MKSKAVKVAVIGISILLILLIAGIVYVKTLMNTNTIYDNIFINDVNVSKMTVEQAETALKDKFKYGELVLKRKMLSLLKTYRKLVFPMI